jgi:hypothetical protein
MFRIFGDILHSLNQRDDVLLGGRDEKEHRKVLRAALQRAINYGFTFIKEKCQKKFEEEEIEFFGRTFT